MTVRLLIEGIVRQMTVLLAELATSGGIRAPLANVADRVFMELARELESHGVSRAVSADMFGLALRTYLRRLRRHDESVTQRGQSLWEAILDFIQRRTVVSRGEVLSEFERDDEGRVRSVLQDLTDSGAIYRSGVRGATVYRATAPGDFEALARQTDTDALDAIVWAIIRREGPLSRSKLGERTLLSDEEVEAALQRLGKDGRVEEIAGDGAASYQARSIVIPVGASHGWEAAVYDHLHAVIKTIICKLRLDAEGATRSDRVGGSTYTFEVWDGHPSEEQVYSQLARFRTSTSALRREVESYNEKHGLPTRYDRVTVYMGQCSVPEEESNEQ